MTARTTAIVELVLGAGLVLWCATSAGCAVWIVDVLTRPDLNGSPSALDSLSSSPTVIHPVFQGAILGGGLGLLALLKRESIRMYLVSGSPNDDGTRGDGAPHATDMRADRGPRDPTAAAR